MNFTFHARRFGTERPTAILLGGLSLVRALGAARIPVIVAAQQARTAGTVSRHASAALKIPPLVQAREVVDTLLGAAEQLQGEHGPRTPLFYGSDDHLELLEHHGTALSTRFAMILNDPEVSAALINKDRFQTFATAKGLPIPREIPWSELKRFDVPVLAKPRVKTDWHHSTVHLRIFGGEGKAHIFPSGREAMANALVRSARDDLMFQEYVPGGDRNIWSFHGFADETGQLLAWFVGRKIRTYPPLTGVSTYLELAYSPEVAALDHEIVGRASKASSRST